MISFSRYLLTAGTATCVDVAIVQCLLTLDLLHEPIFFALAIATGALAGMSVNFLLSRRFVFRTDHRPAREQFASFVIISMSTLVLRLVVAYGLVAILTLPLMGWISALPIGAPAERLAHLGAVGLVTIYSFLAHKHVSFAGGILNRLAGRNTVVF